METETAATPWYRKRRYLIMVALLAFLLIISLVSFLPAPPKTSNQVALDRTISYFAKNYDSTVGLISTSPGSSTYWLYPDNYMALLAISGYNPGNSSTSSFALALAAAFNGYTVTLPSPLTQSQYTALNSTTASFDCSANYTLSWSEGGRVVEANGSAVLRTSANDQSTSCTGQNHADLLFLQALYYNRLGNLTAASNYYKLASADYDGRGLADQDFGTVYQTYKLALFVYTASCLGYAPETNDTTAVETLFSMQDNATGGFYAGYTVNLTALNAPQLTPTGGVNTETTAMAALALEQLISPSSAC